MFANPARLSAAVELSLQRFPFDPLHREIPCAAAMVVAEAVEDDHVRQPRRLVKGVQPQELILEIVHEARPAGQIRVHHLQGTHAAGLLRLFSRPVLDPFGGSGNLPENAPNCLEGGPETRLSVTSG